MPRARVKSENKGLPARWRRAHGAFYYTVPAGQEKHWEGKKLFRLGKTVSEAFVTWGTQFAVINENVKCKNVDTLLDHYLHKVVPTFSVVYQEFNRTAIINLRKGFGHLKLMDVEPIDINQYMAKRSIKRTNANGKITGGVYVANREIEIFQAAFAWAVWEGYISRHPFKDSIKFKPEKARTRYIEDWEVQEALSLKPLQKKGSVRAIQAYIRLKLITGMAKGDLLRLTMSNIKEDGIHIQRHKTAKATGLKTTYLWSPELREAVNEAIKVRPAMSPFLFCTDRGEGYFNEENGRCPGWKSMWQRFMKRVLAETKVVESFTDHDLRAKRGSDVEDVEEAAKLLSHANSSTTKKHYRRKPVQVATGT